jgi:alkylation response protein AidB-like acyl-CoA dehydrogenase
MTLLCAEAVGAIETLLQATVEHVGMREQFGKPLRAFQVVDHAVADMRIALEEARTAVRTAVSRLGASPDQSGRSVSAAMAKVACLGRRVAHHAIQFHGAMGVTDELAVGDYAKRLLGIACELGTEASALDRFASLLLADRCWSYLGQGQSDAVDGFALDEQTASFRVEVADWLDGNLPAAVAEGQRRTTAVYADAELAQQWHKLLYKRGWAAPNWPKEFGGTGWNAVQRYVWAHETAMRFAPITSPLGLPLVGPVLFHYGTAEQQARYLPPIVSGEELWCQGFSEPGAGSDLAALSTRAVLQNDCYVVNGTKIWTTQGHEAQMMAALVRTGAPDSRREGISFLLIDMQSPGVEIRPIRTIGGDHELNQIFFDDVRVPVSDRVGAEGQGWEIARFLLEHERGGDIMSGAHRALLRDIHAEAVRRGEPGEEYRRTVARIAIDIDTLEAMELFVLLGESKDSAIPSILKLRASEIQQAVTELGVEVLGSDAIRWVSRRPLYGEQAVAVEDCFVSRYLNSRANTIFGGAREIQKTLIARTVQ